MGGLVDNLYSSFNGPHYSFVAFDRDSKAADGSSWLAGTKLSFHYSTYLPTFALAVTLEANRFFFNKSDEGA